VLNLLQRVARYLSRIRPIFLFSEIRVPSA
jgi:hypothetical protein